MDLGGADFELILNELYLQNSVTIDFGLVLDWKLKV